MDKSRDPLDLWAADRAALSEHTRTMLPSLDETRRLVLASATHPRNREPIKEKNMSFVKRRPALAVVLGLLLLAALTPVAYAVVNHVIISVDPDKPAADIEKDVSQQLERAGIAHPVVTAHKDKNRLEIGISSDDQRLASGNLAVDVRGGDAACDSQTGQRRIELAVQCDLTDSQREDLIATVSGHDMTDLLTAAPGDQSDADLAAAIVQLLADHGFADANVNVQGESVHIEVTQPPGAAD